MASISSGFPSRSSYRPDDTTDSGIVRSTGRSQGNYGVPSALEDVLSEIEKYKDNPYVYELLMNAYNTYAQQKFSPNFLQQISATFGDDSAEQNFINSQVAGLRQEIAEILKANHIEDVSSAFSELADMKSAGINVDLQGGEGISPREGADIDNSDLANPVVNDGSQALTPLLQTGAQICSFALQAYQGFMSVKSLTLDNLQKELSVSSSMKSLAWQTISEGVSEFMTSPDFDESLKDDPSAVSLLPSLVRSFGSRVNNLPLNRRQRKALHSLVDELVFTYDSKGDKIPTAKYETLINNTLKELYGSRADATKEYGRIGADVQDIAVQRFLGEEIYRPLNEMAVELQNDLNHVAKLQAKFDSDYLTQANKDGLGRTSASADFVTKKLQLEVKKSQDKVADVFRRINSKLDANTKIGPNWKMAFETALAMGESFVLQQFLNSASSFHFGINARTSVNDTRDVFLH